VRWVLLGISLGAVPPIILVYLPRVIGWQELLSIIFGSILIPLLVVLLNKLQPGLDIELNFYTFGALALCMLMFNLIYEPLRKRYWRFIDRLFFRTKYSYGRTIREFNEKLEEMLTGEAVLYLFHQVTLRTINPLWVMFVDSNGEWRATWKQGQEPDEETDPELSIPFPELDGLELWIGPKKSGMAYHDYDRALLNSLAGLASTSLRRELLQRRLLEEKTETERLVALNQLKDDFLSLVSHDLRSPLSAILFGADLLARRSDGVQDEESKADAIRIKRNVHRMAQMVERLLHTARVEAGRVEPEIGMCRLHDLADSVFERHELLADNAGVALDNAVPEDATAETDAILLQEAVSNLVDNALKVSERGMRVQIGAEKNEGGWILTVTDYGPGIPEEKLEGLFDRGAISGTMQRTSGFGLGLYLVDQLVRLLKSTLELKKTSSHGTTFALHLHQWTDDE